MSDGYEDRNYSVECIKIGNALLAFAREQAEWSAQVFGPKEVKNSEGPWKHCAKEILVEILGYPREEVALFLKAWDSDRDPPNLKDIEEIADVIFFVNEGLWRMGLTWAQLLQAMHVKLAENKARDWPAFDPAKVNEPVEHVREQAAAAVMQNLIQNPPEVPMEKCNNCNGTGQSTHTDGEGGTYTRLCCMCDGNGVREDVRTYPPFAGKTVQFDLAGKPFINSRNDPFDPPPEVKP